MPSGTRARPADPQALNSASTPQATLVRELARAARLHERAARGPRRSRGPSSGSRRGRRGGWSARTRISRYTLAMPTRLRFSAPTSTAPTDFAQRDADLARVVSIMTRMLPGRAIMTIAQATELNALSQELDAALLSRLPRCDGIFTVAEYCAAFRWGPERDARERQIGLVGDRRCRPRRLREAAVHPVGARDDAAAGAHRRTVGAARLPGARIQGVSADGRREGVPGHHRPARARAHGCHFRWRRRPFSGPVGGGREIAIRPVAGARRTRLATWAWARPWAWPSARRGPGLAEVLVELLVHLRFDRRLEQRQHEAELAVEAHRLLADVKRAREPGSA